MSNELKVSHKGNKKLGPKVSVLSRSVGENCPDTCSWLNNGCYAQKIERIYPNAKRAYQHNTEAIKSIDAWQKIRSFLIDAKKKGNAVRFHQNGDFMTINVNGDKVLDGHYIDSICRAYESLTPTERPKAWLYTHVPDKRILELEKYGVACYGSVDGPEDHKKFKAAGFRLFAFKSSNKMKDKNKTKVEQFYGIKAPVCWEQLSTKSDCGSCGYCINARGSISFISH